MPIRNSQSSYGAISKFLHWSIVLLIIAQFLLANVAEDLPNGIRKLEVLFWHKSSGMLVLLLALVRVGWRLANPVPLPPPGMPRWQNLVARTTHGLLYLLILAQPVTGWMMSSAKNFPVSFFGLFQWPDLVRPDESLFEQLHEVHETLAIALLTVAALHVAAALYHHFWMKDNVLRRMLPFARLREATTP